MRIGIDYFPAGTHAPGVGRYARELTRALVALPHDHSFHLLDVGRAPQVMPAASLGLTGRERRATWRVPARLISLSAKLGFGADKLLGGVDVFHHVRIDGPPVSRAPQSFAVSEWPSSDHEDEFLDRLTRFQMLFVFCEEYKKRLVERGGRDSEDVFLLPVGADHWLRDLGTSPKSVEREKPDRLLVLGAAFPDRRHLEILEAAEWLVREGHDIQLMFAGSTRRGSAELRSRVASTTLGERFCWREPDEQEMPKLVAQSSLLLHLCDDVGTAVTPLESLVLGVPCLLSPVSAFQDTLGDSVSYFDRSGTKELAQAILSAMETTPTASVRQQLLEKNCWRENALATLAAWERICGK